MSMENIILYAVFCLKYDFFLKSHCKFNKIVYNYIVYSELDLRRFSIDGKHRANTRAIIGTFASPQR